MATVRNLGRLRLRSEIPYITRSINGSLSLNLALAIDNPNVKPHIGLMGYYKSNWTVYDENGSVHFPERNLPLQGSLPGGLLEGMIRIAAQHKVEVRFRVNIEFIDGTLTLPLYYITISLNGFEELDNNLDPLVGALARILSRAIRDNDAKQAQARLDGPPEI